MATAEKKSLKKEIYTYAAPWMVYSKSWSMRRDPSAEFRLAVGSFIEEYNNKVQIIQLDAETEEFKDLGTFDHPYPATKIMFIPDMNCTKTDLLATTGDYLRVWKYTDTGVVMEGLFNSNKRSEYCAPLTSFDWNTTDMNKIVTSSIDTTCTIWNIEAQKAEVQLIAHDKEVFDVAWATRGRDIFGSVGADGSVRLFDQRKLDHSTIIYESPELTPLLRLEWNNQDPNYLAMVLLDSPCTVIVDIRVPSIPVAQLRGHTMATNGCVWAPHSSVHICTASDDTQALIWDVSEIPKKIEDPILAYTAPGEINQLNWSALHTDWVSIAYQDRIQLLRV
mmetsp:Transcript_5366/g.17185  ORF Transcript_5366/g.17185 Transcript_5366/m.17185 type:complete len:335 (+) Transcript_5366:3-1007(+)